MKNKVLIILIALLSQISLAQKNPEPVKKTYQKIDRYKKLKNIKNVNLDSLEYIIHKGDTLIRYEPKTDSTKVLVDFDFRDSTFLNYYIPIAFRATKSKEDSLKTTMKYWRNDIKIFFSGHINKKLKKTFLQFAEFIDSNVDSLSISTVKTLEDSNYVIYTTEDYNYEISLVNSKKSNYHVYWNTDNKIYKGSIKLNNAILFNDQLKLYKLKKLFVQSLGHFNYDKRLGCKYFFSNCYSPKKSLTKLDLEILKYHYSYGICKGINLESFLNFHKQSNKVKAKGSTIKVTHLKKALQKDK